MNVFKFCLFYKDSQHRYNEMDPLFKMYMTEYLPAFPASFDKLNRDGVNRDVAMQTVTLYVILRMRGAAGVLRKTNAAVSHS